MDQKASVLFTDTVHKDWVDYNGHMSDASYARVFAISVDRLMQKIGVNATFRKEHKYTFYTLETHICYLKETFEGRPIRVTYQLLDHDHKRLHVFFVLENEEGERLATSEQMVMGIDMQQSRSAPFPAPIMANIEAMAERDKHLPKPSEAGRVIGIRRK